MNVKCNIDKKTKRPVILIHTVFYGKLEYYIISISHAKVAIKALKRIIVKLEKYIEANNEKI